MTFLRAELEKRHAMVVPLSHGAAPARVCQSHIKWGFRPCIIRPIRNERLWLSRYWGLSSNGTELLGKALLHLARDLHPKRLKYGPALHGYRIIRIASHLGYLAGNMSSATVGHLSQKDAAKHTQSGVMKVVAPAAPGQGPFFEGNFGRQTDHAELFTRSWPETKVFGHNRSARENRHFFEAGSERFLDRGALAYDLGKILR
jgi:hypothetical protein